MFVHRFEEVFDQLHKKSVIIIINQPTRNQKRIPTSQITHIILPPMIPLQLPSLLTRLLPLPRAEPLEPCLIDDALPKRERVVVFVRSAVEGGVALALGCCVGGYVADCDADAGAEAGWVHVSVVEGVAGAGGTCGGFGFGFGS